MAKNWHQKHQNNLTAGEKLADIIRNFMGSWFFVFSFVSFILIWTALNLKLLKNPFDPYPFILLNLFLSFLAGIQGSILLIAAKRQDQIASALAKHDYETNVKAEREIREIKRLTEELHKLMRDK